MSDGILTIGLILGCAAQAVAATPEDIAGAFGTPDLVWSVSGSADGVPVDHTAALQRVDSTLVWTIPWSLPNTNTQTLHLTASVRPDRTYRVRCAINGPSGCTRTQTSIPAWIAPGTTTLTLSTTLTGETGASCNGGGLRGSTVTFSGFSITPEVRFAVEGARSVRPGEALDLSILGDPATYTVSGLPPGLGFAQLSPTRAVIQGAPQPGLHPVRVTAHDGVATTSEDLILVVSDPLGEAMETTHLAWSGTWSTSLYQPPGSQALTDCAFGVVAGYSMAGTANVTTLTLEIPGPGTLRWRERRQIDLLGSSNYTARILNGQTTYQPSSQDWEAMELVLPPGPHTIQWVASAYTFWGGGSTSMLMDAVTFTGLSFAETMATLPAGQQTAQADPDGDGAANLVEYGLGSDPASPTSMPAIRPVLNEVTRSLEVRFPPPPGRDGVSYLGESSADGKTWLPVPDTGHSGWHAFSLPLADGRPLFRVRVQLR